MAAPLAEVGKHALSFVCVVRIWLCLRFFVPGRQVAFRYTPTAPQCVPYRMYTVRSSEATFVFFVFISLVCIWSGERKHANPICLWRRFAGAALIKIRSELRPVFERQKPKT